MASLKLKKNNQNNKVKPLIGLILIIIIILIITIFIYKNNHTANNKQNTLTNNSPQNEDVIYNNNNKVIDTKIVDNVTFTNIECYFDGNQSTLDYTIINNGNKNLKLGEYEIIIKDKNNNILAILAPTINYELKPGETYDTGNIIDIDLSTAYAIEMNLNNK